MTATPGPSRDFSQIPNNWENITVPAGVATLEFDPPLCAIEVGTAGYVDVATVTGTRAVFKCAAGKRLVGYWKTLYGTTTTTATDLVKGW